MNEIRTSEQSLRGPDLLKPTTYGIRNRALTMLAMVTCGLFVFFYLNSFKSTIIDDAFIHLKYADTLSKYFHWGFYPGYTTNTATSPLNVILTAALGLFTISTLEASFLLTTLEFCLLFLLLFLLSNRLFQSPDFAVFASLGFATNPLLLSTLGMESFLFTLLLVLCLYLDQLGRTSLLAFSLGLLTLTRFDGVVLFLIYFFTIRVSLTARFQFSLIYLCTLLPWHLFSWIYLGNVFPDTLILKTNQQSWTYGGSFHNGLLLYGTRFGLEIVSSFFLLPFGLFILKHSTRNTRKLALMVTAYTVLHYIAYSFLIVPPYHWYYSTLASASILLGSLGIACLIKVHLQNKRLVAVRILLWLLPVSGLLTISIRDGWPLREAPIHTNWGTHDQYKEIGQWLEKHSKMEDVFLLGGEIGTLAYYSDRILINNFSNSAAISRMARKNRYYRISLFRPILDWNFYWRNDPPSPGGPRSYILKHVFGKHAEVRNPNIVHSWNTHTKWIPNGKLYLQKIR